MQVSVCFIVTNYNNSDFTAGMVNSIAACSFDSYRVVIVDNNSSHSERKKLEALKREFPDIVFPIFNGQNVGYFPGLNIGIAFARKELPQVTFYVVGNNDLIFPADFGGQLKQCKSDFDKYPVISPNIVMLDGSPQNPHVISHISKAREFVYDLYHLSYLMAKLIIKIARLTSRFTDRKDEQQSDVAQEIYQGYGACYILGPLFFEHFDELWAPTFLMYEEFFLSRQLEIKGFKIYYEPMIKVQHHCHASTILLPGYNKWLLSKAAHKEYRKYVKIWRQ